MQVYLTTDKNYVILRTNIKLNNKQCDSRILIRNILLGGVNMFEVKHICMIVGGVLLGSAGVKLLSSKDAKKAYTHVTAAVMRCADSVMETATTLKENCEDIKADAQEINDKRREEERLKEIEDAKAVIAEAEEKLAELESDEAEVNAEDVVVAGA